MKNDVLNFLRSRTEAKFNVRQIAKHLQLHSGEYKLLRKELKTLVKQGKLIVDRQQRYTFRDENRVLKGRLKMHAEGFGFFIPDEKAKADVFIPRRMLNHAMNGDAVLVESYRNSRDGRYEGRVIQVIERSNQVVVGTIHQKGDQFFAVFRDAKLGLDEIYVPKKNLGKATHNDFVAVKILQYPGPGITPIGEVTNVIGVETDDASLRQAILIKNNVPDKFPDSVNRELEHLPDEVDVHAKENERVDLRDVPIITIDGITAKDFDDAVCVLRRGKGYVLYVSIADVAEYVKTDAPLDKEAYRRGTSTYLPGECIPMLPEKLSNGLCSLNPHVPRYTLTAEIHYNSNFDFTHAQFYKSLIQSHKRATYDEVQAYYDGTGGHDFSPEVKKSLDLMKALAEELMRRTEARGTMGFDLPEPEFVFDNLGKIQAIKKRQRFFSHKLIEQFMIAANVVVAQYFTTRGLPLLYRIHDEPDSLKVQSFVHLIQHLGLVKTMKQFLPSHFFREVEGHRLEPFLQTVFLRSLKQAVYSPDNIGHYGLALQDYAHFTSPIRRYPDLTVHRQLRSVIEQSPNGMVKLDKADIKKKRKPAPVKLIYSFSDLEKIGHQASQREREAMDAERDVRDLLRSVFIKDFMHEKFFGIVSRINKYGLSIELDPHYVEGFLPLSELKDDYYIFDEKKIRLIGRRTKNKINIGDRIYVTVAQVDPEATQIKLEMYAVHGGEGGTKKKKRKRSKEKQKGRRKSGRRR